MMSHESRDETLLQHQKGLITALKILDLWGIGEADQGFILNIDRDLLNSSEVLNGLTERQLLKISYILNIHASLRELFQNPENYYGFMQAVNHNSPYCGRTPSDFVVTGELDSLKKVFESLERLKYGQ